MAYKEFDGFLCSLYATNVEYLCVFTSEFKN